MKEQTRIVSEDRMIQAFLEGEIEQVRHQERYASHIASLRGSTPLDEFLHGPAYSDARLELLSKARGWPDKLLFRNFPHHVTWYETVLHTTDLANLRYIDYSYWDELSNGTRLPLEAAKTIQDGTIIYDQSNDSFWEIADLVRADSRFGPVILLQTGNDEYTIVEGHKRITGFALAGHVPEDQISIVGKADTNEAIKWSKEHKT